MRDIISDAWEYIRDHDAPNWFVIVFSLVVWPAILLWWTKRKRQSISHFLVTFTPTDMMIGKDQYPAILLTFINQTGSITYLYHVRLTEIEKLLCCPRGGF